MFKKNNKKIKANFYDTNLKAQCTRLLEALRHSPVTTLECRKMLSIMHPSGRVLELRKQGHRIVTHWINENDSNGCPHRIARYVLFSKQAGGSHV